MLNKVHKRSPLHLHRLAVSVIQGQDKVEEVGLAEIWGWLLLKMSSGQSYSTEDTTGRDLWKSFGGSDNFLGKSKWMVKLNLFHTKDSFNNWKPISCYLQRITKGFLNSVCLLLCEWKIMQKNEQTKNISKLYCFSNELPSRSPV